MVEENFKVFLDPSSDSFPLMKKVLDHWNELKKRSFLEPQEVAKVIQQRIEMKNPPFRTLLSRLALIKLVARRLLPYCWFEKLILATLKI